MDVCVEKITMAWLMWMGCYFADGVGILLAELKLVSQPITTCLASSSGLGSNTSTQHDKKIAGLW